MMLEIQVMGWDRHKHVAALISEKTFILFLFQYEVFTIP
jgi:hypothetical protein